MRRPSRILVWSCLLVLSASLAGCLSGEDVEEDPYGDVEWKAPVSSNIQLTGASAGDWFEPGSQVQVKATAPEGAVGSVNYTWALQPDPFTVFDKSDTIDTGNITPGESAVLSFDEPGFFEFGHCDPHPWMEHTVAVLEDYEGPDEVNVFIVEGELADQESWKFYPEHVTIGVGTKVTYVNQGAVPHTASVAHEGEPLPVPEVLDLRGQEGTVTLDGSGWMNLLVFMEDEEGNTGWAKQSLYVRDRFDAYSATNTGEFTANVDGYNAPKVHDHEFLWSGTVHLNVTVTDETGMLNKVDVELREDDGNETFVPIFVENGTASAELQTTIETQTARKYQLVVRPSEGALIEYSIDVEVVYDHTPPELIRLPCPEPHYSLGHC